MTERLRYYALVLDDRTVTNPYSVFRDVHAPDSYRVEIYDRALGAWREELSLGAYIFLGEMGAERISRADARIVIKSQTEPA